MEKLTFTYTVYIRSTREKVWDALTSPETNKLFWDGEHQRTDWKAGSPWALVKANGDEVWGTGEVIEFDPPNRFVVRWDTDYADNAPTPLDTRFTFTLEAEKDVVKLTLVHEIPANGADFLKSISGGWPWILSSLKSLLETGNPDVGGIV